MLIDTHLHLFNEDYDIDEVISRAKDAGVKYLIVSGSDLVDNKFNEKLLDTYDNVFLSVGYHPSCALDVSDEDLNYLEDLIKLDRVVAIGEIGLDYHYGKDDRDEQIELFRFQLDLAVRYNLPVVIHTRDAFLDTYNILKEYNLKGVIHCFLVVLKLLKSICLWGIIWVLVVLLLLRIVNLRMLLRKLVLVRLF